MTYSILLCTCIKQGLGPIEHFECTIVRRTDYILHIATWYTEQHDDPVLFMFHPTNSICDRWTAGSALFCISTPILWYQSDIKEQKRLQNILSMLISIHCLLVIPLSVNSSNHNLTNKVKCVVASLIHRSSPTVVPLQGIHSAA